MFAGDFNVSAHTIESSNYNDFHTITTNMRDLIKAKIQLSIFYYTYNGPLFTWSNHYRPYGFLSRKFDKVLVNDNWSLQFPVTQFDHYPIIIHLQQATQ